MMVRDAAAYLQGRPGIAASNSPQDLAAEEVAARQRQEMRAVQRALGGDNQELHIGPIGSRNDTLRVRFGTAGSAWLETGGWPVW